MKGLKSLLLGAAAGIVAVSGASAADLGAKKPSPVEYVRACYNPLWGTTGGFIIPGTQTCLRISGQARFDIGYAQPFNRGNAPIGYRGGGFIAADAITPTEFGNLRAFAQVGMIYRSGNQTTGTGARQGTFFGGTFANNAGAGGTEFVFSGFIQFAGFTAGRTASFFNPVGTPPEVIGSTFYSSPGNVTTLAYTANLGNGFLATIAIEDPTTRRAGVALSNAGLPNVLGITAFPPLFAGGVQIFSNPLPIPGGQPIIFAIPGVGVATTPGLLATGLTPAAPGAGLGAVAQVTNRMPNIVAALRLDQAWGSASLSAMIQETSVRGLVDGLVPTTGQQFVVRPGTRYGYAIAGGVKINLPMIAAGDALYLNASFSEGLISASASNYFGGSSVNQSIGGVSANLPDYVVDVGNGRMRAVRAWSINGGFQHFWTPQLSSTIFGGYLDVEVPRTSTHTAVAALDAALGSIGLSGQFGTTLLARSARFYSVGFNTVWQPVRGLNIAGEVAYVHMDPRGRTYNYNTNADLNGTLRCNILSGNQGTLLAGSGCRTKSSDGAFSARLRITRDF